MVQLEDMGSLLTIERIEAFTPDLLNQAAEESLILRDYPPNQDGMALTHELTYTATDDQKHDGYICFSTKNYHDADADIALAEEAPALHQLVSTLQTMPSSFGETIPAQSPSVVINFAEPGGRVSRHIDSGNNTRNWIGRCVSLTSTGLIRFYPSMESVQIAEETPVKAGDITSHFNPASKIKRHPHDVLNTGDETRISVGVLVALKRSVFGL